MKKRIWGLVAAGLLLLSVSACSTGKDKQEKNASDKQEVNMMEPSEITSMNTLSTQDTTSINAQTSVFEGLYSINDQNEIVPAIATELPEISDDGNTYTIKLRDDAKWTNGDPVTAKDFVFAWQRLADPANQANYLFLLDGTIKNGTKILNDEAKPEELGVKALDDQTLEVTLERPVPYFTSLLTFPPFYPQNENAVKKYGKEYGSSSDKVVSNGAFTIENWDQTSQSWELVKNPDYYDADKVKLDQVNFNVIKDPGTAFNLFENGELDAAEIFGEFVKQNKENPNLETVAGSKVYYFKMNQKKDGKETIFANTNVRKAVAYAVDKKKLVDYILADGSQISNGYIPRNFVSNPVTGKDFREDAGELMQSDPEQAKQYWEKAKNELGGEIKIELLTTDTDAAKKVAEYLQEQLEKNLPGLKLEVRSVPLNNSIDLTKKSQYELAIGSWGPDYQDPTTYLNTLKTPNNTNYESEVYDDDLQKINETYANELEKRWETMIAAEKLLVEEDTVIVPLYQQGRAILTNEHLTGIYYPSFGAGTVIKYAEMK